VGLEDSRGIGDCSAARSINARATRLRQAAILRRRFAPIRAFGRFSSRRLAYGRNVTYAAVVDNEGRAIAHSFPPAEGQTIEAGEKPLSGARSGTIEQIRTIYADRSLEVALPLELGDAPFGAIRVGLSPSADSRRPHERRCSPCC
jgi:hypothetical protein